MAIFSWKLRPTATIPLLLLFLFFVVSKAQNLVPEPQPDQRTLDFANKYKCAIVKLLVKQGRADLPEGAYSDEIYNASATGFYINSSGDVLTATHTFDLLESLIPGYAQTRKIINSDGSSFDFLLPSDSEIEDGRLSDILTIHTNHPSACFLSLGSSASLKPGQEVFTIGFPGTHNDFYVLGRERHQRPLSQRGYFAGRFQGKYGPFLKMQLYGTVGASGSPIMTKDGSVIGVVSKSAPDGSSLSASPVEERYTSERENRIGGSHLTSPESGRWSGRVARTR